MGLISSDLIKQLARQELPAFEEARQTAFFEGISVRHPRVDYS